MLKIGWASCDVSTNEPVTITGQAYERISKGSMDPTTVTALYLEDGGDCVVFRSGDFSSFEASFLQELKASVAQRLPGFDPAKIILNATHTHTAPRYYAKRGYDKAPHDRVDIYPAEKYRAFLLARMTDTIAGAYETAAAGSVSYGYSSASIGFSRRSTYFCDKGASNKKGDTFAVNGHSAMYGKTNDPEFAGFEGSTDTYVYLLFTFDEAGKLTGALVNVPCPSQCTEHEEFTSADYWNEAREAIRKEFGNIFILPQCAAAGDLSPHLLHNLSARERQMRLRYGDDPKAAQFKKPMEYYCRRELGEKIAHAVADGFRWASREQYTEMPIRHVTEVLALERWQVSQQQYDEAKENLQSLAQGSYQQTDDPYGDFKVNTRRSSEISRCEGVIARFEDKRETEEMEIHVVTLGDIAFTTCPHELYIDYQHRIQARSPYTQTFMVQLAASSVGPTGYLCTERAAQGKGYSAISYSCQFSPQAGQNMVERILQHLNEN
jgi:hypothetical protein